jgi:hypothetical protein
VRRGDTLTPALAPGGGQAIRFVPAARHGAETRHVDSPGPSAR